MAHYAFIDASSTVTEVIPGRDEGELGVDWESYYGVQRNQRCFRTSYWTRGGKHLDGGTPFRKNYAGIGFTYDHVRDAFIPPKPDNAIGFDEETCLWIVPEAEPITPAV